MPKGVHNDYKRCASTCLFDDVLSGGEGDLDGAVHHGQQEVLHRLLYGRLHTVLQLGKMLEQSQLEGGRRVNGDCTE